MNSKILSALGVVIMIFALFLFVLGVYKTLPIPPTKFMHYVILIFTVLGINFGISSGRKLAYNLHDRDLLLKRIPEGSSTSVTNILIKNSIIFASLTVILWSIFIIVINLSWSVIGDRIFIGETRWLMIASMIVLICGSFLFYKVKSSTMSHMLTRTGKKLTGKGGLLKETVELTTDMENMGKNVLEKTIGKFWR